MRKSKIAGLMLVAVAVAIMIVALTDSSSFVTFEDAAKYPDREFHVIGELAPGKPVNYDALENPNLFSFYMKDSNGDIRKVYYNDAMPQDFERSDEVVVTGRIHGNEFRASKILMKCPSKYTDDFIDVDDAEQFYEPEKEDIS
jgi:cytochrome c-type biogenesis protein CcmE